MMEQRLKKHSSKPISWPFHASFWTTSLFCLSFGDLLEQRRYFPSSSLDFPWLPHIFAATERCPPNKKPLRSWEPWWAPHWQRGHKYLALRWVFSCQAYHGPWWGCGQPSHVNPGLGIDIRIQRIETKPAKGLSDYPAKVWHCAKWEVHKKIVKK